MKIYPRDANAAWPPPPSTAAFRARDQRGHSAWASYFELGAIASQVAAGLPPLCGHYYSDEDIQACKDAQLAHWAEDHAA